MVAKNRVMFIRGVSYVFITLLLSLSGSGRDCEETVYYILFSSVWYYLTRLKTLTGSKQRTKTDL